MRGVYIHIPFCKSICSYCDFCKMIYNDDWANLYISELQKEIGNYYENDEVKSIYIGGGTPSSLNILLLNKLMTITRVFKMSKNCEFTFEMNVDDIEEEKLKLLKMSGVNRISVGIESFNKYKLKFLNRKHDKKEIKSKIKLLKEYFDNINVDFIYAVPVEDALIFKKDLRDFIKLDVEHISTYSLIIEDGTVLSINNIQNISEDMDAKMYKSICTSLRKKDYNHYEVSNFSKRGYESIHNQIYWNNKEYYGFGLGAHGYINDVRYENTKSLNKYLNSEYRKSEYIVSTTEDMENELIFGLRKLSGINIKDFYDKYNKNIQDVFNLGEMVQKGFLKLDGNYLRIPEDKIYIMNEILENIIK